MNELTERSCVPCEGGEEPLEDNDIENYMAQVPDWDWIEGGTDLIRRKFKFADFSEAMHFVNQVADIAENAGHHPDIYISYDVVRLELYTHAIGGLHENDFILAAKVDDLL